MPFIAAPDFVLSNNDRLFAYGVGDNFVSAACQVFAVNVAVTNSLTATRGLVLNTENLTQYLKDIDYLLEYADLGYEWSVWRRSNNNFTYKRRLKFGVTGGIVTVASIVAHFHPTLNNNGNVNNPAQSQRHYKKTDNDSAVHIRAENVSYPNLARILSTANTWIRIQNNRIGILAGNVDFL